jgi:hypothetical protein
MIQVTRYEQKHRRCWDEFVTRAKNGVFLFQRDYMEYHQDRFRDHSLLFFNDEKVVALMPANADGKALVSHGGLTFGGVISDNRMRAGTMLEIFDALLGHLAAEDISRLVYKAVPHIYHNVPAEEDLYALFRTGARLIRRDVSSTISQRERISLSKGRKWSLNQSQTHGLNVRESADYQKFMEIETEVLKRRYNARPVHSAAEIAMLADRFLHNIKLFAAFKETEMVAGVVIYESKNVAHAQYMAANDEGKQKGALDCILDYLIKLHYAAKPYFDFGVSTEQEGKHLNNGLAEYKESFGARAVVYDFYEINV